MSHGKACNSERAARGEAAPHGSGSPAGPAGCRGSAPTWSAGPGPGPGTRCINPIVYGCAAPPQASSRPLPNSTTLPAYITGVQVARDTPQRLMSWVIMISVERRSRSLQVALERVQNLPLHDHIQRRHRLVRDHQQRVDKASARGDRHPLAHPAAELVRVGIAALAGFQPDHVQNSVSARSRASAALRDSPPRRISTSFELLTPPGRPGPASSSPTLRHER